MVEQLVLSLFFFFNDTATTEIYTLSLHDALPISRLNASATPRSVAMRGSSLPGGRGGVRYTACGIIARTSPAPSTRLAASRITLDRKSTRLNSSHANISYAVFCLKKKKTTSHETY